MICFVTERSAAAGGEALWPRVLCVSGRGHGRPSGGWGGGGVRPRGPLIIILLLETKVYIKNLLTVTKYYNVSFSVIYILR